GRVMRSATEQIPHSGHCMRGDRKCRSRCVATILAKSSHIASNRMNFLLKMSCIPYVIDLARRSCLSTIHLHQVCQKPSMGLHFKRSAVKEHSLTLSG